MTTLFGLARIGRDAEVRYAPNGDAVCGLSLAFTLATKDKDGKRETTWVDAALWGKRAESLAPRLTKGRAIAVSISDIKIEHYTTKDGRHGAKLVGRVADIEFAGGGEDDHRGGKPAATAKRTDDKGTDDKRKTADASPPDDDDIPF